MTLTEMKSIRDKLVRDIAEADRMLAEMFAMYDAEVDGDSDHWRMMHMQIEGSGHMYNLQGCTRAAAAACARIGSTYLRRRTTERFLEFANRDIARLERHERPK